MHGVLAKWWWLRIWNAIWTNARNEILCPIKGALKVVCCLCSVWSYALICWATVGVSLLKTKICSIYRQTARSVPLFYLSKNKEEKPHTHTHIELNIGFRRHNEQWALSKSTTRIVNRNWNQQSKWEFFFVVVVHLSISINNRIIFVLKMRCECSQAYSISLL